MSKKTKEKEYLTIVSYLNQWEEAKVENNIDTNYEKGGMKMVNRKNDEFKILSYPLDYSLKKILFHH